MKKIMSKQLIGVLALLCSSVSMGATVTVTSSNLSPNIGDFFTITLVATDLNNNGGGTLDWGWNAGVATIQHLLTNTSCAACLPSSGPLSTAGNIIQLRPNTFDVLPNAPPLNGNYDIARFTFQATAAGALAFFVGDDGGTLTGWFDNDTAEPIQTNYQQANIVVQAAPPVPVPAAAWLLISALGSMVVLKRRPL